jgi:hypothetical protein
VLVTSHTAGPSEPSIFASESLQRHLARGALGFGLIGAGFGLSALVGPAALLLAPAGLIALRGCPMCWTAGLIETISAGRVRRRCSGDDCTLSRAAAISTSSRSREPPDDVATIPVG